MKPWPGVLEVTVAKKIRNPEEAEANTAKTKKKEEGQKNIWHKERVRGSRDMHVIIVATVKLIATHTQWTSFIIADSNSSYFGWLRNARSKSRRSRRRLFQTSNPKWRRENSAPGIDSPCLFPMSRRHVLLARFDMFLGPSWGILRFGQFRIIKDSFRNKVVFV